MRIINILAASLLCLFFWQSAAAEDMQKERFQTVDEAIVLDAQTGLMWARQDNGSDIDWWEAKKLCEDSTAGGYSDWRLPDIKELAALYTNEGRGKGGYSIAEPFRITECCMWSSYDIMGGALIFNFNTGKDVPMSLAETYQLRVLPVRGTSKMDRPDKGPDRP